jgi:hypothetical protein
MSVIFIAALRRLVAPRRLVMLGLLAALRRLVMLGRLAMLGCLAVLRRHPPAGTRAGRQQPECGAGYWRDG